MEKHIWRLGCRDIQIHFYGMAVARTNVVAIILYGKTLLFAGPDNISDESP